MADRKFAVVVVLFFIGCFQVTGFDKIVTGLISGEHNSMESQPQVRRPSAGMILPISVGKQT